MVDILVNGVTQVAQHGERLIEVINRSGACCRRLSITRNPAPNPTCDNVHRRSGRRPRAGLCSTVSRT